MVLMICMSYHAVAHFTLDMVLIGLEMGTRG